VTPAPTPSPAPALVVATANPERPKVIRSVPTLGDVKFNPSVVSTNFGLALVTLLILILTAVIFNETLEENEQRVHGIIRNVAAPFAGIFSAGSGAVSGFGNLPGWMRAIVPTLLALALAAALYGLEEPGSGFNQKSLVLFLSYLVAFTLITYSWDGAQALACRYFGVPAVVRVFPVGVVVAIIAVALTRITGFQPGLMYGFVAANAIIQPARLTDDQEGKKTLFASVALLSLCAVAWVLVDPLRTVAEDHSSFWAAVPEGIAVGLFVAGLEGLFFQMIPIEFLDGRKLWKWNKVAWFAISLVSGFLFWEALINDDQRSLSAVEQTKTIIALVVVLSCLASTIALWMFFKALGPLEDGGEPEAAGS
jgi:hypothetical protein